MFALMLLGLLGTAVGFGVKFWRKSENEQLLKVKMIAELRRGAAEDVPAAEMAYIEGLFESSHHAAFEAAYSLGGRRSKSSFDEKTYFRRLLGDMATKARRQGRSEIADHFDSVAESIR